jgi:hypothetical protein
MLRPPVRRRLAIDAGGEAAKAWAEERLNFHGWTNSSTKRAPDPFGMCRSRSFKIFDVVTLLLIYNTYFIAIYSQKYKCCEYGRVA